jgi:hypothetical protein
MTLKRKIIITSILLLFAITAGVVSPFLNHDVFAERLDFDFNHGGSWHNGFSKHQQLVSNSITISKEGMKIKKAELVDPKTGNRQEISGAAGQLSWTGIVQATGMPYEVESLNNKSAKGYYAWYRFTNGTGENIWQADLTNVDSNFNSTSRRKNCYGVDDKDKTGYTSHPDCGDSDLTLSGGVQNEFYTMDSDKIWVNLKAVNVENVILDVKNDEGAEIEGPQGTIGRAHPSTLKIKESINPEDYRIYVWYSQDFSQGVLDKAMVYYPETPQDKLAVYFAAFTIDIKAKTYFYGHYIEVEYEPHVIAKPDLGEAKLTALSCVEVGKPTALNFSYRNLGVNTSTSFRIALMVNDSQTEALTVTGGITQNEEKKGTFTYTFQNTSSYTVYLKLDTTNSIAEESESNNESVKLSISPKTSCNGGGIPETVTAKLSIDEPTLVFGETNDFRTTGSGVTGGASCSVKETIFTVTQGSINYVNTSNSLVSGMNFPAPYRGMTTGSVSVTLEITSTCGGKATDTKTFELVRPPSCGPSNSAPIINAGWFRAGDGVSWNPINEITVNSHVWLRVANKPAIFPGEKDEPYDPDGDRYYLNWDFDGSSSEWVKSLKEDHGLWVNEPEGWRINFRANVLGNHSLRITATDVCGNQKSMTATLSVVPPEPIPIITPPGKIIEGRSYTPDFDGSRSYSPSGYKITQYIWGNKLAIYPTAGEETVTLDVVDQNGLRSLYPASSRVTVHPDLPPVVQLEYSDIGVRGSAMQFKDTSFSPDADPIETHTISLTCDRNNNGSYSDEVKNTMTLNSSGYFTYTPNQVGKCQVQIFVQEGVGLKKSAQKTFEFEVVNLSPEADFSALGTQPKPANVITTAHPMNALANSAAWTSSSIRRSVEPKKYEYVVEEDALRTINRPTVQPYKGITSNNVQVSYARNERSYCGGCGSQTSGSYFVPIFNRENRLDRRLWTDWYAYFYHEDNPNQPTYPGLFHSGTSGWSEIYTVYDYNLTGYNKKFLNRYQDQLIGQGAPYAGYYDINWKWSETYWSLNAIRVAALTTTKVNATVTSRSETKYGPRASENPGYQPPPPQGFTPEPETRDGVYMEYWNRQHVYPKTVNTTMKNPIISNYNQDLDGNIYKTLHSEPEYNYDGDVIVSPNIKIQKISPSGLELWSFTGVYDYWSLKPFSVEAISSDNAKVLVKQIDSQGNTYKTHPSSAIYTLLNNHTGTKIKDFKQSDGYFYMGQYGDYIFYVKRARASAKVGDLIAYHMLTGVERDLEDVHVGSYAVISADGKLILADFTRRALVYDAISLAKESEIPIVDGDYWAPDSGDDWYYDMGIYDMDLVEDGRLKILYSHYYSSSGDDGGSTNNEYTVATIQTTPSSGHNDYSHGYLSSGESLSDGDLQLKVKFHWNTFSESSTAGIGFRAQDHRNMYRAELTPTTVRLSKIVNGTTTVIQSRNYTNPIGSYADVKVRARGNRITVFINGVPLIEQTDSTFGAGHYGIYSEAPYVYLKDFKTVLYSRDNDTLKNVSIVNMPITYSTSFIDPENDPAILSKAQWEITNTAPRKFLDTGDGTSDPIGTNTYNRVVLNSPYPALSKVGLYRITYMVPDDPAPSGYRHPRTEFASYQKMSDPATHDIIVHRLPVCSLTVTKNADSTLTWIDGCYDPDRWLSTSNYSTEATGINYQSTRGIIDRRYWVTTPSGVDIYEKVTRPTESGTYIFRISGKDEYGAESDWAEATIVIDSPPPPAPPNAKPVATVTAPNGTEASPTIVYTTKPVLYWRQSDSDGDRLKKYQIVVTDANGKLEVATGVVDQDYPSPSDRSWTVTKGLVPGQKYKWSVRVVDAKDAESEWASGWMVINGKPTVTITYPNGTKTYPTMIESDKTPMLHWTQVDNERNYFDMFSIQIQHENGDPVYKTPGAGLWQGTSSVSNTFELPEMPTKVPLQARMQVSDDGNLWSDSSNTVWFIINYPPTVAMTFPTGTQSSPTPGNPTPLITWERSDPDPDTEFRKRQILIRNENGNVTYVNETIELPSKELTGSYQVTSPLPSGQKVRVTVKEWDEFTESSWATETWMLTNRPPVADFDWSPKPMYEGDTITLHNLSTDPDGDSLTAHWQIRKPNGEVMTINSWDVISPFILFGNYEVRLTVQDGVVSSSTVKLITVNKLLLQPEVEHTPAWLLIHQEKGHQTAIPPKDFYSGETLVVKAAISPAPVESVVAWIDTVSGDGESMMVETPLLAGADSASYMGELFHEAWMEPGAGLPQGLLQVYFRVRYSNGIVKEEQVPIRIIGNVYQSVGVHRVQ